MGKHQGHVVRVGEYEALAASGRLVAARKLDPLLLSEISSASGLAR